MMKEITFYQILIIGLILVCSYLALTNKMDSYWFNLNMPVNVSMGNIYVNNQTCECDCNKGIWTDYYPITTYVKKGDEK